MVGSCSRADAVALLRRTRGEAAARQAEAVLPDPVQFDRDRAVLVRLGLSAEHLISALGGSP